MSERLYFTQSGLIDYIMRTVTEFNRTIGTTHIATDFFCDNYFIAMSLMVTMFAVIIREQKQMLNDK